MPAVTSGKILVTGASGVRLVSVLSELPQTKECSHDVYFSILAHGLSNIWLNLTTRSLWRESFCSTLVS